MIQGLNHLTLSVRSLEKSFLFYQDVMGFKPVMRNPKSAYFSAGSLWFCIEEDPKVRAEALPEYTHFAFSVSAADFPAAAEKIRNSGAFIFKEIRSEGDSLYFLDPNGHKLEIHVGDLQSRIATYKALAPEGMQFFEENGLDPQ